MKACLAILFIIIIAACGNGGNYADKIKADSIAISKRPIDTIKTNTTSYTNGPDNAPIKQVDTGKRNYADSAY